MLGVLLQVSYLLILFFFFFSCPNYYADIPWIDNTHVSLSCEWGKSECMFQFWKDREEQFYCELSECSQTSKVYAPF